MSARMGANRYGKDGIRLVLVRRGTPRHELRDLTVDVRLEGDFDAVHTEGDNAPVLPTDTMRSTVYALAQAHLTGSIEEFGAALADRFLAVTPAASVASVSLREHGWTRVTTAGGDHPHAFVGGTAETATADVIARRGAALIVRSGLAGLTVLKTTQSAFAGYLRDEFTVLPETHDRILATEVTTEWSYAEEPATSYDDVRSAVRDAMVLTFADHDSQSVQHTLWAMGEAALERAPAVSSVWLRMPNKHHVIVDLEAVGVANDKAVFVATDRPYGVIEGTVERAP